VSRFLWRAILLSRGSDGKEHVARCTLSTRRAETASNGGGRRREQLGGERAAAGMVGFNLGTRSRDKWRANETQDDEVGGIQPRCVDDCTLQAKRRIAGCRVNTIHVGRTGQVGEAWTDRPTVCLLEGKMQAMLG